MTSVQNLYSQKGGESNLGVDYVIHYQVPAEEREEAEAGYVSLIEALTRVGLATEVRTADQSSLLVFVKAASEDLLKTQVYRSRIQDWLYGVRSSVPGKDASDALKDDPITEAERLLLVYLLIIKPKNEGGAGITAKQGRWKHVESIFPLHDHSFNKQWLKIWSSKYLLDDADLNEIRNKFGEQVAFYFAFTQAYFRFLILPAAFGFGAWLILGRFSFIYALTSCLWSVVFFEYWKKKEVDLAVQWGVRGVSKIHLARPQFKYEYESEDPVTGEAIKVYPPMKRFQTQLLQVPFAFICILSLGMLIAACNSLEIFTGQVYDGPLKQYLTFLPTILIVTVTPTASALLMRVAEKLTDLENYETMEAHNAALVQKQFVLNFMTSYMPLLFTLFFYIPFGHLLHPMLEFWGKTAKVVTFTKGELPTRKFLINPGRIGTQMFSYTITAQFVSFATEVVVPYLKNKAMLKVNEVKSKNSGFEITDHPEEKAFLERVRTEMTLTEYSVTEDYREMVMQFGYMSLFSVSWPLTACCFLINNWIELRSDALKIATTSKRPIPWRSDSIGPWLSALGFLSWLGSLCSSAIVYLCKNSSKSEPGSTTSFTGWGLLLAILLAEHFYLLVQLGVGFAMSKVESPGLQKERKERYLMKKSMLMDTLGQDVDEKAAIPGIAAAEKITREALEEEARQISIRGHGSPQEIFWQRQRGMDDTIKVGRHLVNQLQTQKQTPPKPSPSA